MLTVVVVGAVFWKTPTMGSYGTAKDTVHAIAFTENGVIAIHDPLTSSKGFMGEGFILHGYGDVTSVETFVAVETLMLNALMSV